MTNVIAMVAFAFSFIAASITLVEWFLSERQKAFMKDTVGNWSSDMSAVRQQQLILDFGSGTPQWVLSILSLTISVVFMSAYHADTRSTEPEVFWIIVASLFVSILLIGTWVLPRVQTFISKHRNMDGYGWTVFRVWFGMTLIYFLWWVIQLNVFSNATGAARLLGVSIDVIMNTGRNTILAMIYLIILARVTFLVRPTVFAGEVVLRRLAESSQGPLLKLAGLSSAIGTFLKLFAPD